VPEPTRQADILAARAKHGDIQGGVLGGQGDLF